VFFSDGYPATVNAYPECVKVVTAAGAKIVGEAYAAKLQRTMGAEDFSFFLEERPGDRIQSSFFFLNISFLKLFLF